jgi:HemY protein
MARFILFLLLLIPIAHAGLWLAERPGNVTLQWLGWQAEISLTLMAIVLAITLLICVVIGMSIWAISKAPKTRALKQELSRTKQGLAQLNTALIATRSQDYGPANRALMKAGKMLPDSPLPHLIGLQLSVRNHAEKDTRAHLSALRAHDDTAPLALQQLIRDAFTREDYAEARALITETCEHFPRADWVQNERVRLAIRTNDIHDMQAELARVSFTHRIPAQKRTELRAALYHTQGEYEKALRIVPHFAPSALAISHMSGVDDTVALRHLYHAWKHAPSAPLLHGFLARTKNWAEKPLMKQAKRFANAARGAPESHDIIAACALQTGDLEHALNHAKQAIEGRETPERFERIAQILKEREGADAANPWLQQALEARSEEVWACTQCGAHTDAWQMECAQCGSLGDIYWTARPRHQSRAIGQEVVAAA